MRVWDIPPEKLCRQHLLGEHSEIHALWSIITEGKSGFAAHPETARWRGKLKALYSRHEAVAREIESRGFRHSSPLPRSLATGREFQDEYVDSPEEQVEILRAKGCGCDV